MSSQYGLAGESMKKLAAALAFIIFLPLLNASVTLGSETQDEPTVGYNLAILSPCNRTYNPDDVIIVNSSQVSMIGGNLVYVGTAWVDGNPYPLLMESSQRYTWDPFFGWLLGTAKLPELAEGQHNLTVNFKTYISSTGRRPSVEGQATVFFSIADKTPPKVTLYTEAIYNKTSFPLNFTVNEPTSWTAYSLDGGEKTAATENATVIVATGNHTIIVYANDTSGNMGQSEVVHFTVQAPTWPQTGDLAVLAAIVITCTVAIAVLLVIWKRKPRNQGAN